MKILLLEDEIPASKRMVSLLKELEPTWEIVNILDEVSAAEIWLKNNPTPDLIFMDIHLADGHSFALFDKINIQSPVIFATAFDQYAVNAFKVNGLDYLLKPISKEELQRSINRFKDFAKPKEFNYAIISSLLEKKQKTYKERFVFKSGEQLNFVRIPEIAFFTSSSSYSFVVTKSGNRYLLDQTMDHIQDSLDPALFFRINRKQIVSLDCITKISAHFNSRLKLELNPSESEDVIVSRNRVTDFKEWLDR
ncbi:MAG: LytTR family DNA-binding domain-containing protein [Crocinitomicaceae bacterium]